MRQRSGRPRKNLAIVAGLATALCCASLAMARPALALTTDELQARIDSASQAYDSATAQVAQLQSQIEQSQATIDDIREKLPEQREKASVAMRSMYKMQQSTPGLVTLLLTSSDFADFLSTYQYIDAIQKDNLEQANQLAQMEQQLTSAQQTLSAAKEQASQQQQAAQEAMSDAQATLDELNRQIAAEKAAAEQAEREAAEKAAAEQAAREAEAAAASTEAAAATEPAESPSTPETPQAPTTSDPSAKDGSEVETDGEWMIGSASAYSMADNTGWDSTASGEKLTDDSLTVAVPASQSYLLGRSVQIRWGGKTITARVNDTGGFAAYGRVLDLAGGVWKAFGFSSASDWGVRTVQYRFL